MLVDLLYYLSFLLLGCAMAFDICYALRGLTVRGTVRHFQVTRICRIAVFPGWALWPEFVVSIVASAVTGQKPPSVGPDPSNLPLGVTAVLALFLILAAIHWFYTYSRDAIRFLKEDDYWNNRWKRARKSLESAASSALPHPSGA